MEFVGKLVEKEFKGYGVFSGIVQSYDASSGFFEVVYEDGDSEELDFSEVASLLQRKEPDPADHKQRIGRRPKKRRRIEPRKREDRGSGGDSGNSVSYFQAIAETLGRQSGGVVEANGKFDMNQKVDLNDGFIGNLREDRGNGNLGHMSVDLNEALEKRSGIVETLRESGSVNGSLNGNCCMKEALDLNAGFNLNLNEGFDLNEESDVNSNGLGNLPKRECIDLNLDVNGNVDEDMGEAGLGVNQIGSPKKECGFDLNLGIDEEIRDTAAGDCGGETKESTSCQMVKEETQKMDDASGVLGRVYNEGATLKEVHVVNDSYVGLATGTWKDHISGEDFRVGDSVEIQDAIIIKVESPEVVDNQGDTRSANNEGSGGCRRRGRRRKSIASGLNSAPETTVFTDATVIYANEGDVRSVYQEWNGCQRRLRRGNLVDTSSSTPDTMVIVDADVKEDCTIVTDGERVVGSTYKEVTGNHRKKRKFSDHVSVTPQVTVLRRSTRRGSARNNISTATALSAVHDLSVSPAASALTEEKHVKSCHEWAEEMVLPPQVQLPPSSQNLDLDGIPVIDFFSVYACLRSFSTLLFLSPFELEEFLAAVRCISPSSLFDSIHFSILQTLRSHLEYLSNEGSESASICLRSLNWGLLDLITWPVFMVEYLLLHGSDLRPWFNLSHLKLLKNDYYKQPVPVKVEILRCLCDEMIEVEAIRSELNRRSSGAESELDFDRNTGLGSFKKRRIGMDIAAGSCLTEEAVDDATDWNSDECCLCKMDGSLICCDGCPAAFHSKCVGVDNDSLPEGDWFCPECAINSRKPWMKPRKSLRGAELLGVDPYGRLYFSSCGYLLVSDSCETESSCNYYHRDALIAVIRVLRSSEMVYSSILEAIHKHWDIPVNLYGISSNFDLSYDMCMRPAVLASSETCTIKGEATDERKPEENLVEGCSGHINFEVSKSLSQTCVSSEGSAETTQTSLQTQNFQKEGPVSDRSADFLNESDIPGKFPSMGDNSLTSSCLDVKSKSTIGSAANVTLSSALDPTNGNTSQVQLGSGYMNYYSFGHIASSIAEELIRKSSDKTSEGSLKTDEEIISAQLKIISKRTAKFCWSSIPRLNVGVLKEKCGWCFTCRISSDELGCLFNMCLSPVQKGPLDDGDGLQLRRNKKGHLKDIINHILLIEDRLHGLLSGPWLNPHYSRLWRKSVLKSSDIVSVKHLLLILESNLHRLALSAEWLKHMDSATTMGSASHIVSASLRASSKNGIGRKRARYSEFDSNPSSNSASGLGMLWWRGGRISRRLFSWKVLPRSLVSKAARQVGCMKIPGMLYPENSEFAKRSKYVCWRAAVESSTTVEQLALQVRELDSNIRWDEIGNTNPLAMVDKEFKKSFRLFKKVIIRRKCIEGEGAKYLLDFGKRKVIPEIVLKNGSVVEESSSERKKYWLNESYVPLYLLKSFESKRIARRSNKTNTGKLSDPGVAVKKPSKKKGFSYLFAKAERSEYHQCGHCNKDVPIREAVCCQSCKGFFHKRHVRKSAGSITAECMYTCHRCLDGKNVKNESKTGKRDVKRGKNNKKNMQVQHERSKNASVSCRSVQPKNSKKALRSSWSLRSRKNKKVAAVVVPLRRSPRKAKYNSLQNKKGRGRKKGKQVKSRKATYKKLTKVTSWRKGRTETCHSFWINGLRLSRKPDDERVMHFKNRSFLAPSKSDILAQPKCHLCCEDGYTSTLNYISCDICGEWFHGDAFGLDMENINKIIGFRCHVCRKSTPPVCPPVPTTKRQVFQKNEVQNDVQFELSMEATTDVPHLCEMVQNDVQDELSEEATTVRSEMVQNDVQNEISKEATNAPHLMRRNSLQESLANEDHQGSLLRKQQSDTTDSDQNSAPGSRFEVGKGQVVDYVKEDTGSAQISSKNLNPEVISGNGSHLCKENTFESGDSMMVTASGQMQTSSCNVDVDVMKTELDPSGCESARDSLSLI